MKSELPALVFSLELFTFTYDRNKNYQFKPIKIGFSFFSIISFSPNGYSQAFDDGFVDDDLNIGGDIFNDFNEDLESTQIMEDERFYRYGRFFSFQVGIGVTSFDGNRGPLMKTILQAIRLD